MKTLFIGNSYTFFNDLPKILEDLSRENGKDLTADSVTKGGRHLYQNLAEEDEYGEKVKSLIKTNEYDALFLQEQSFFAIVDFDKFLFGVESLKNLVSAKRTILYATWGRKSGSSKLEELGRVADLLQHRLEPLLELAAVRRAGHQRGHVEREHHPVPQAFGDVAAHDALREPFDDRGLADARLADQHRVVLGLAREDADHVADLGIAADHRVEPAGARQRRKVAAVLLEHILIGIGLLVAHVHGCLLFFKCCLPRSIAERVPPRDGAAAAR